MKSQQYVTNAYVYILKLIICQILIWVAVIYKILDDQLEILLSVLATSDYLKIKSIKKTERVEP